jgi:hypothetical protein
VSKARHTRSMDVVTAYDFRLTLRTPLRCVALRTPAVMELNTLPHGLSVDDEAALLYEEQRRCRTVLLSNMVAELQGLAAASLLARLQAYGEIESLSVTPSGGAEAVFATLEQAEGAAAALDNSKTDWRFGQRAKLAAVKPATNRRVKETNAQSAAPAPVVSASAPAPETAASLAEHSMLRASAPSFVPTAVANTGAVAKAVAVAHGEGSNVAPTRRRGKKRMPLAPPTAPTGPKGPDGTRGFAMGRGRPLLRTA